jgi:putative hydrolase of the HAD superfamily
LSCEPADVWMVGDNLTWDIAPALKLGMQGIWVDHARKGLSPTACCEPSRTIHAITELLI